jgi:archaetidylinositol phosphate synthase
VFFAQRLKKVSANTLSWLAFLFAILAGCSFFLSSPATEHSFSFLLLASFLVFLNGLFDAIDGKVATLTKSASKQGDFLDHALDRFADVFIVGGLSLSAWCDIRIGFFAIVGMLLTSYMGTQSQAVGYKRVYAGLLGRADRLVLLMIGPIVHYVLFQMDIIISTRFNVLEFILIILAVVGNITAMQRFYQTMKWFQSKKRNEGKNKKT